MNILITGAGGYIGSHCALKLASSGHSLFALDFIRPNDTSLFQKFYVGDQGHMAFTQSIFKEERIECIIHCSGTSNVGATISDPIPAYCNDLIGMIFFLKTALEENVKKLIFLSSVQVYGNVTTLMATENTPPCPTNTHGRIKLAIEQLIESLNISHGLRAIVLRIGNVIGMDPKAPLFPQNGDLISNILLGNHGIPIFGNNYTTSDHSAERDFIHVNDVVQAILLALPKLNYVTKHTVYNITSGRTYSVKEIIRAIENITHRTVSTNSQGERSGEIARLAIDSRRAQTELDWHLQCPQLNPMIESSVNWLRNHGKL
ncbi:MAG: NAD-dependent epimerase/dehydratase family protein [Puniceicoccales bacterium]|nr:NAD-dependent epimerase/dehydratase family protein [Puniceicoccales bacterium]